ncbi:3-deoxy-D-manno-octulosonic acid transferase [Paralimibaculum aggregatum]|uniref:3-deoxy-D-manno-octulosonic acid transferase n=1 Tax=Paralimibaculum aggregatum TaxID=3036245 RepID=A0ABQ6LMZ0_9RHOB|nr:glycosyltransferase N-terminal domain-containing protein [Limibaculum sp. NKW23]GMG81801.1 3-deoxy-D-manno-octulosonic acid transferase [Limibaculum sp. NKW23]
MRVSVFLPLYLAASVLADPLARRLLARRAARGKEDIARLGERLGSPGLPRPEGRLVWLHGASVGEAASALPLIEALLAADPALEVLLTTGTRSAAEAIGPRLPARARHQYAPVDTRAAVRGFLSHWRPDLAIWLESEFWPRLMLETARAGTPMALVNARVSAASARAWGRARGMAARILGLYALVLTQDEASAARLAGLGVAPERISAGGNLKGAVVPPAPPPQALAEARAALAGRRVWLAASTHEGEEAAVAAAQQALPEDVLAILAPRHPERGDAVAGLLAEAGLATARRSAGEAPGPATRVWLADTLGEMGLWYALAPVVFVGGSLAPRGGHTPFEPAAFGAAILHGPDTANFAPAYAALAEAGGAEPVDGAPALARAVARLLEDDGARGAMAAAAGRVRRELTPDLAALAARLLALAAR